MGSNAGWCHRRPRIGGPIVKGIFCLEIDESRALFHVTIVRLIDVRSRRRENVRPPSLRTSARSTLRRRSYAGRIYDHSEL